MREGFWKDYQKIIATDNYFYERSCIRQTFFPGSEKAFLRIIREELELKIIENKNLHTCTGIGYYSGIVPLETSMTVIARLFSLMSETNSRNFVPSCVTTFGLINEVLDMWAHFPEKLESTRKYLKEATGRTFELPQNVAHPSDIIFKYRKELKEKMLYQLIHKITGKPLRVVEHIGCHYSKIFPQHGIGGAEFPQVLSGIIKEWGGQIIDYPERRHCCGFGFRQYLIMANRGYSIANSKKKFESMKPYKPDLIITNCPGCSMFMDRWQYTIAEMEGITYDDEQKGIPVFTYEELTGLLLGYDPWQLGLQLHQVQTETLLEKIGISYNPEKKYYGKSGKKLLAPLKPVNLKV